MAEPRETGKEVNGASHPGGVRGKRSALERLNIVSNIVVALMAVFATVISLSALHMQSQDQAIAARGRAAAAFKAQRSFADRIVPLWTASSNGLSVYLHIQNDNALPVEVWVAHLPGDNQLAPDSSYGAAITKPGNVYSLAGTIGPAPYVFIGQVPPCTEVEVHAPFASFANYGHFKYSPSQSEGDTIFTDPSGLIWAISPSGILRPIQYHATLNISDLNSANFQITDFIVQTRGVPGHTVTWASHDRSPICG